MVGKSKTQTQKPKKRDMVMAKPTNLNEHGDDSWQAPGSGTTQEEMLVAKLKTNTEMVVAKPKYPNRRCWLRSRTPTQVRCWLPNPALRPEKRWCLSNPELQQEMVVAKPLKTLNAAVLNPNSA